MGSRNISARGKISKKPFRDAGEAPGEEFPHRWSAGGLLIDVLFC